MYITFVDINTLYQFVNILYADEYINKIFFLTLCIWTYCFAIEAYFRWMSLTLNDFLLCWH